MESTDRRSRAHAAIRHLALELSLPTELNFLSDRWNTVARLGGSDIVAKAATLADLAKNDPRHWFEQEVVASTRLFNIGAPVQQPVDGRTHLVDGLPITLWYLVDGEMGEGPEEMLVESLHQIHHLGRSATLDQPWFATITVQIPDAIESCRQRGIADENTLSTLDSLYRKLIDKIGSADLPGGLLHGDAQRKNSIYGKSVTWIDFEETSSGPYAWDLACLSMHGRFDTSRILDHYAEISGSNRIAMEHILTLQELRKLQGLTWMLAIQEERDEEFRSEAMILLQKVLSAANDG